MKELIKNDIKHPEIVLAQAKLETGYYKSQVCKTHHNLFGLRGKDGYYKFPNWQASVKAYRDYVQYRYDGQSDYFAWLDKIGYAEDESYIRLVKHVMECNKS
jgi:flagellum-specific peptidoglycan hydrolase FlgJ